MQDITQSPRPAKHRGPLREATALAARTLGCGEQLLTLVLAYLFCTLALFVLFFLTRVLNFFPIGLTPRAEILFALLARGVNAVVFLCLLLPLLAGRARMAGMVAAGKNIVPAELFHYFGSPRAWWRGVRIGLLLPLALLVPPLFSAPALAIGNEALSLRRSIVLSVRRVPFLMVLGFWGRALLRFLLGLLTLGILWLLYDAHHLPTAYFALVMQEKDEPTEEIA